MERTIRTSIRATLTEKTRGGKATLRLYISREDIAKHCLQSGIQPEGIFHIVIVGSR